MEKESTKKIVGQTPDFGSRELTFGTSGSKQDHVGLVMLGS
jgi:hypothetical protein